MSPASPLATLHDLRARTGARRTVGLPDAVIARFLERDPALGQAIAEAADAVRALEQRHGALLSLPEAELIQRLQEDYVNFYPSDAVNPYVPVAARGPWIVTSHGAVVHDSGGYGMLGLGHAPDAVLEALARPWVVANVMTASFSQLRFAEALRAELGHTRPGGCPFARFICMNSGSESVTVAMRISDLHAKVQTSPGGPKDGRRVRILALEGGFHGRTTRPARASASTAKKYERLLASFRDHSDLVTVPINDVPALHAAFEAAERDGSWFEILMMEPVMGEGNPGMAITRAFYDAARALSRAHGTLFLIDSIQAGLRAHGCLSIVDYPGFTDAEAPDMETWSKALNGAQYPLSVVGLTAEAAAIYQRGVYGNTMTTNPRAVEVGLASLHQITPALRANIRARGAELVARLEGLAHTLPDVITHVQGTGLLVSAELDPRWKVVGAGGIEERCRTRGIGVIHGGENSLRFTPHFAVTSEELGLLVDVLGAVLRDALGDEAAAAK